MYKVTFNSHLIAKHLSLYDALNIGIKLHQFSNTAHQVCVTGPSDDVVVLCLVSDDNENK